MPGPSRTHTPPDRTTTAAGRNPEQTGAWERLRAGILRHAVKLDQRLSFDIRLLLTQTDMAHLAGRLLWARIQALEPQVLVAPGFGAMPLAYATAHAAREDGASLDVLMVRDQRKTYHQKRWVEGHRPAPGTRAVVVDDFMGSGSVLDLVDQALAADGIELQLQAVAVFFDMWEPLGSRQMQLKRLPVIRLFTRHDIGLSRDCHDARPPAMKGSAPDFIGPPLWWRMGLNTPGRYPYRSSPVIADNAVFVADDQSRITRHHAGTGDIEWTLMALFALALLWACLGRVDIVAVAPGRIVVSQRTKVIQPLEASVVREVRVQDGDHVQAGQVLVELDPTMASADRISVQEQYLAALSEELRSGALLQALDGGNPAWPSDIDAALSPTQLRQQWRIEWQDITARLSQLQAEIVRKQAELTTTQELLAKLDATLPMSRTRESDYQTLVVQGFISGHATQDRTRERVELERDRSTQRAKVDEAQAGLLESRQALQAYLAETRRTLVERQFTSRTQRARLQAERIKAEQRERQTLLKAPVAGVVQQLAVHSVGGVVIPAQPLMVVVPDADEVTALVQVANLDIGFVHQGQKAEIKLETFPYTVYGTVPAHVTVLGGDAITDEKTGVSTYPATLTLERRLLQADGKALAIAPGMNVTAEIKTGQRRIIEFLLSPIVKAGTESLRER